MTLRGETLRVPPHSIEAEQAVLGGLLLVSSAWPLVGNLAVSDFYRRDHQLIFRCMGELADKNRPFDAVTLGEWFESQGLIEQVAGGAYLVELACNTPSAANISAYADIVADKAKLRRLIDVGTSISNAGYESEGRTADELLADAVKAVDDARWPQEKATGLRDVPLEAFMETPPNTIGYAVHPIVPRGVVTLWGGHGGAGKSMSALQLLAHGACGIPWQGLAPDGVIRSVYFSLEDPGNLVRYRLRRVCESYGLDERRVELGVKVFDCPDGKSSLMGEIALHGIRKMVATPLMSQIRNLCAGADLIVIDNASDAYGGNENDRQSVRAFMSALTRIASEHDAGLVLLSHIDKAAARTSANGNTYSGSTAWHNSARSRLAITTQGEGEQSFVQLLHEKNNLGKRADPVSLRWNDHGVLVPIRASDLPERAKDDATLALAVVEAANQKGIRVPVETVGQNPSHKPVQHFTEYAPFAGRRYGSRAFHTALDELHKAGRIVEQVARSAGRSHPVKHWVSVSMAVPDGAPNDSNPAPNAAPNPAPNAPNDPATPPYKTPFGGLYRGGASDSALHSAHSAQEAGNDDVGGDA